MTTTDTTNGHAPLEVNEARYLVDTYYELQEHRKATGNQARALEKSGEPHQTIDDFFGAFSDVEEQIRARLDEFSSSQLLGQWARSHVGVGPVIAAGLLAHIDLEIAKTAGSIYRFGGVDPTIKWEKGQKRPFNAKLKVLLWKLGESFVRQSGHDDCFYGHIYRARKEFEVARDLAVVERDGSGVVVFPEHPKSGHMDVDGDNIFREQAEFEAVQIGENWFAGGNAACAAQTLEQRKIRDPKTRKIYESGHLPAGRLDLRARRYAVKLFISHYHEEGYKQMGKTPTEPFALSLEGHSHYIPSPVPSMA